MIYISHRGNLDGPTPEKENHPDYIMKALHQGFDVELDVWFINNKYYLGHNEPTYEIKEEFLYQDLFWQHAKNLEALSQLMSMSRFTDINCFYHISDDYVLTSKGWIWTYPGKPVVSGCIAVKPEKFLNWDVSKAFGICTDYPFKYKESVSANKDI